MTRNIYQVVCRLMRKIKDMLKIKNIERSFMISEKKIFKEEMSKSNAFWHILLAVQHENRKAWKMMNWLRFIYLCYWNMNLISLPILSYVVHSSDSLLKKKTIQCCQNWIMNKKVLDNLLQKDSFTTVNSFVVFFNKMFYSIFVQFTNMKGNINLHSYNNHQSQ